MLEEKIQLRDDDADVALYTYVSEEKEAEPRRAVLVLPGGAYCFLAEREGEPVARHFNACGFNTFVLKYSVHPKAVYPRPLQDASLAVMHIKRNARKYNIDPDKITVCGFSAGGHLAAALGTLWYKPYAAPTEDMEYGENKPCGVITSYPVVTLDEPYWHKDSSTFILGTDKPTKEQRDAYSLEKQVTDKTVPMFIWHTFADTCVPVENSLILARALADHKIPLELHIYPTGDHGMSLCNRDTWEGNAWLCDAHNATWADLAAEWIRRL